MAKPSVLAIGLDPSFSRLPDLTPDLVRHYIDVQIGKVRDLGYDVESCLIDHGETAAAVVADALASKRFDCIVIGAGLREPPERLLLFETILNLVHERAPGARIASTPTSADTVDAVRRWIG